MWTTAPHSPQYSPSPFMANFPVQTNQQPFDSNRINFFSLAPMWWQKNNAGVEKHVQFYLCPGRRSTRYYDDDDDDLLGFLQVGWVMWRMFLTIKNSIFNNSWGITELLLFPVLIYAKRWYVAVVVAVVYGIGLPTESWASVKERMQRNVVIKSSALLNAPKWSQTGDSPFEQKFKESQAYLLTCFYI